ncbi:hypothetical protein PRUPE_1G229400 [Prunus persica]|uniref:Uncharacterized protein n=1 Tax=Prunus persica TaxID=3760 RepID=M5XIC7_PRUPE|nr:hypothetical protein PRUPE_1G229400 [Prunus persica]
MSTQDVNIDSYSIKDNAQVIVNAWQIGRDPETYDKPEEFEPERFLNSTRGLPRDSVSMALKEIALANLVHKFDWELPWGAGGEDLDMNQWRVPTQEMSS